MSKTIDFDECVKRLNDNKQHFINRFNKMKDIKFPSDVTVYAGPVAGVDKAIKTIEDAEKQCVIPITIPNGLGREEKREFIMSHGKEIDYDIPKPK